MDNSLRKSVLNELHRIEPRLPEYAAVAPAGVFEVCESIFSSNEDVRVRANALYLAFALDQERGLALASQSVSSPERDLRIAAMRCFMGASPATLTKATTMVSLGLEDSDPGVRKYALKLLQIRPLPGLHAQVDKLAESDEFADLRQLAKHILSRA